ncbi:hypothetical protein [Helicobacter cetorum]|uniref:Uncharacterized protein n=1 Tax=Helicobacter cetorum (strain ATCC BAA-429 / MIT 00-7128) TaxID=182217 RepID=I0EMC1_HELC0|nr:hypothetical protein [Helicobacter cetorum]AFI04090.1 hypothetical protein HCW_04085 [Helicobacter cetorum MIT 00-7128]
MNTEITKKTYFVEGNSDVIIIKSILHYYLKIDINNINVFEIAKLEQKNTIEIIERETNEGREVYFIVDADKKGTDNCKEGIIKRYINILNENAKQKLDRQLQNKNKSIEDIIFCFEDEIETFLQSIAVHADFQKLFRDFYFEVAKNNQSIYENTEKDFKKKWLYVYCEIFDCKKLKNKSNNIIYDKNFENIFNFTSKNTELEKLIEFLKDETLPNQEE